MTDIRDNSLLRAAERVRAQRAAEKTGAVTQGEVIPPVKTTTSVRARLNVIPDNHDLMTAISNALAALSRGVRWARGSILNLLV